MDDFREWLSDNLRYFMLGGAILIIVVVLFAAFEPVPEVIRGIPEMNRKPHPKTREMFLLLR